MAIEDVLYMELLCTGTPSKNGRLPEGEDLHLNSGNYIPSYGYIMGFMGFFILDPANPGMPSVHVFAGIGTGIGLGCGTSHPDYRGR